MSLDSLVLAGGHIVDVAAGCVRAGDVVVRNGIIAAAGPGAARGAAGTVIDVRGRYVAPGFMDSHLHIESSLLLPAEFARAAAARGTTAVFVDPHEIANVLGRAGVELFLEQARDLPLDLYVGVPSCVPATPLEDAGAALTLEEVRPLLGHPRVYGLAEMMNYPAIIHGIGDARAKVEAALAQGKIVDGHCPGLTGRALRSYVSNGREDGQVRIMSDHESRTAGEALDKHAAGMTIALRHGSASKDLPRILPGVLAAGLPLERFMLCSDDLEPDELQAEGHVERIVRRARALLLEYGGDPQRAAVQAIAMATLHPARYFERFFRRQGLPLPGAVAPGRKANLVVLGSLDGLEVEAVVHAGRVVARDGALLGPVRAPPPPPAHPLRVARPLAAGDFAVRSPDGAATVALRVIRLTEGIETGAGTVTVPTAPGQPLAPAGLAKIAVIERHHATGTFAVGFMERCLERGAIASTVAHDSHNLVVVGVDDEAMARAANHLIAHGGGMVVMDDAPAYLPLPVGGLMSDRPLEAVAGDYARLREALGRIGGAPHLFARVSFLALPVIPALRITNRGLVDVNRFDFVSVYDAA